MVRVCHVTSAHNSDDVRIFQKECTSLAKAGYDTFLVAKGESFERNGVHVVGVGDAPRSRLKRMTKFARKIYQKALKIDADIYHLHDPELLRFAQKLKKRGKMVLFDSHEDTLNQMSEKGWIPSAIRPLVARFYRKFATKVIKHLDKVISVTPHLQNELVKLNSKTVMITNFPIIEDLVGVEKAEKFQLCFTGGISEQWCHEYLLDALENINEITYLLCGSSTEDYLEKLKIKTSWSKVNYLGVVAHEQAKSIQSQSHVGIALLKPSKNTGGEQGTLGNTKLFEYMMAGIPVICTNFTLWQDIINKYSCGICVDPKNIDEIANAIRYLLDNPEEAEQMGKNGRKAVEEEFNWSMEEKKLLKLYKELSIKLGD